MVQAQSVLKKITTTNLTIQNQFQKIPTELTLKILDFLDPIDRLEFGKCSRQNYSIMKAIPSSIPSINWHAVQTKASKILFLPNQERSKTLFYGGGYLKWGGRGMTPLYNGPMEIFNDHNQLKCRIDHDGPGTIYDKSLVEDAVALKTGGIIVKIHKYGVDSYFLITQKCEVRKIGSSEYDLRIDDGSKYIHDDTSFTFLSQRQINPSIKANLTSQVGFSYYNESMNDAIFYPVSGIDCKKVRIWDIQPTSEKGFVLLVKSDACKKHDVNVETSLQTYNQEKQCVHKELINMNLSGIALMPDTNIALIPKEVKGEDVYYPVYHPREGKQNYVLFKIETNRYYNSMPRVIRTSKVNDKSMLVSLASPLCKDKDYTRKERLKLAIYSHRNTDTDIYQVHDLPNDLQLDNRLYKV